MKSMPHTIAPDEFDVASRDTPRAARLGHRAVGASRRREVRSTLLRGRGAVALAALAVAVACKPREADSPSAEPSPTVAQAEAAPTDPAQAQPGGWENLLPSATLEGFRRVPIDPLASKAVWQVRPDGVLFIDGVGAKEMLLSEREFGDGQLQIEWRFLPAQPTTPDVAPVYNGGVYVRTPLDGKSWVQLQVARADKPPVVGDLIAQVPGKTERIDVFQTAAGEAPAVGDWVRFDVGLRGSRIELSVDGRQTAVWNDCPLLTGHVGLQAEGAPIEVRVMRFQPL